IAIVFMQLDDRAFDEEVERIADHVVGEGERLEALLVHEVRSVAVAVKVRRGHGFKVGLLELVAGLEAAVEDGARDEVPHLQADKGLRSAGGRRRDLRFQADIRSVFELEESFALDVDGVNQRRHVFNITASAPSEAARMLRRSAARWRRARIRAGEPTS